MRDKRVQQAWREKIALVFIIIALCIVVAFLTFGFTQTVCRQQSGNVAVGTVPSGYAATILGRVYDIGSFNHPVIPGIVPTSYLLSDPPNAGGKDLSFMFQTLYPECENAFIPKINLNATYYFPCLPIEDISSTKATDGQQGCHSSATARNALAKLPFLGTVFFSWEDVEDVDRNLIVYNG